MSQRRDNFKKTLDLPEYPWSSDDDDDADPPPSHQPSTSAAAPSTNFEFTLSTSLSQPSTSQPQPSTSTSISSSAPNGTGASNSRRAERNLFWSMLCNPNRGHIDTTNRPRLAAEMQRRELLRRRADALLKRTHSMTHNIRGMLAIKKAHNGSHHRSGHPYTSALNRVRSNASGPSTSGSGPSVAPQPSTSRAPPQPQCSRTAGIDTLNQTSNRRNIIDVRDTSLSSLSANDTGDTSAMSLMLTEESAPVEPLVGEAADDSVMVVEDTVNENQTLQANASSGGDHQSRSARRKESIEATYRELNQCLLRLLECPVCLDWMEPPMSQCRRGHLVCVRCRARLSACPVCRTTFSSVRNRAMEGVADVLRYPCRHGCAREVRLRRRAAHEASCPRRRYPCPAPACQQPVLSRAELAAHAQTKHTALVKNGHKQRFSVRVNAEQHENWFILALHEIFHLRIDVDIRTWGINIYVAFIGPKNQSKHYNYEVSVIGKHNSRKLVYTRTTHSDLDIASTNVSRRDCFHLSLDQALNFLRIKNRHSETNNSLDISVVLSQNEDEDVEDSCDS